MVASALPQGSTAINEGVNAQAGQGGFDWATVGTTLLSLAPAIIEEMNRPEISPQQYAIDASREAQQAQAAAINRAIALQERQYDDARAIYQPYQSPALAAFNEQLKLVGINPQQFSVQPFRGSAYGSAPTGYQTDRAGQERLNELYDVPGVTDLLRTGTGQPSPGAPSVSDRLPTDKMGIDKSGSQKSINDQSAPIDISQVQLPDDPRQQQILLNLINAYQEASQPFIPPSNNWARPGQALKSYNDELEWARSNLINFFQDRGLPFPGLDEQGQPITQGQPTQAQAAADEIRSIEKGMQGLIPNTRFDPQRLPTSNRDPRTVPEYVEEVAAAREPVSPYETIIESPIYQGLADQQEEAILQAASATGGLRGGNTQEALARYRPELINNLINQQFQRLGSITGTGLGAAGRGVSAGQSSAANIGGLLQQQGASTAGGILTQGSYGPQETGSYSNLGALAGAALGTVFPVVGTALGGAIGGFIDRVFD